MGLQGALMHPFMLTVPLLVLLEGVTWAVWSVCLVDVQLHVLGMAVAG